MGKAVEEGAEIAPARPARKRRVAGAERGAACDPSVPSLVRNSRDSFFATPAVATRARRHPLRPQVRSQVGWMRASRQQIYQATTKRRVIQQKDKATTNWVDPQTEPLNGIEPGSEDDKWVRRHPLYIKITQRGYPLPISE